MQVTPTNMFNDRLGELKLTLDEKYGLYRDTVYHPDNDDIKQFNTLYKQLKNKVPRVLREDFCGIFDLSSLWVSYSYDNKAIAVDIDAEPLQWGKENQELNMNSNKWGRLDIRNDDCRTVDIADNSIDICIANNWSQQVFVEREDMLAYFKNVYNSLKDDGIFMLTGTANLHASPDVYIESRIVNWDHRIWKYVFEVQKTCPYTHLGKCQINFLQDNKLATPFEYPWRDWMICEYLDLLKEVGFEKTHIMSHIQDEDELPEGYDDWGYYPVSMVDDEEEDIDPVLIIEKKVTNNAT